MTETEQTPSRGRRDRNMRSKQERIFRAATELFAEREFETVTTQEISERADIASGTLFRYAASKGELLLMVYNEELRAALASGENAAQATSDPADAIMEMVAPILKEAQLRIKNSVAYQRELLFGAPTDKFRSDGLALITRLEAAIADRLVTESISRGLPERRDEALLAGGSVFASTHLALTRASTEVHPGRDPFHDLRIQVGQIVAGYLSAPQRS